MRAVLQRVTQASVKANGFIAGEIGKGLLVLLAVEQDDQASDVEWLAAKILKLRLFTDETGLMNLNLEQVRGGILVVSQFTLYASTRKGNRPSFSRSAPPEKAIGLYNAFLEKVRLLSGVQPRAGVFGAHMEIQLLNDGPVTLIVDSRLRE